MHFLLEEFVGKMLAVEAHSASIRGITGDHSHSFRAGVVQHILSVLDQQVGGRYGDWGEDVREQGDVVIYNKYDDKNEDVNCQSDDVCPQGKMMTETKGSDHLFREDKEFVCFLPMHELHGRMDVQSVQAKSGNANSNWRDERKNPRHMPSGSP